LPIILLWQVVVVVHREVAAVVVLVDSELARGLWLRE
jgi:hypothetical protein